MLSNVRRSIKPDRNKLKTSHPSIVTIRSCLLGSGSSGRGGRFRETTEGSVIPLACWRTVGIAAEQCGSCIHSSGCFRDRREHDHSHRWHVSASTILGRRECCTRSGRAKTATAQVSRGRVGSSTDRGRRVGTGERESRRGAGASRTDNNR